MKGTARNRHRLWTVFTAGTLAVAGGLLWLSIAVLRSEAASLADREKNEQRMQLRLALWRLDAWMGGFLAREAARAYTDYRPREGMASPLADFTSEYVRLHFELDAAGRLSSPTAGRDVLARLSRSLRAQDLERRTAAAESLVAERLYTASWPRFVPELSRRAAAGAQCQLPGTGVLAFDETHVGPLIPLWLRWDGGEQGDGQEETTFVFVRRVESVRGKVFQGFLGDWPTLRQALLSQIADLFPQAELVSVMDAELGSEADEELALLATLPAALHVVAEPAPAAPVWTSTRLKLGLVWLAAVVAVTAVAFTLYRSIELSERRQRFAGAMAHELRTPLTTFRMYTEMLADGTVQGEGERQEYLDVLKAESERLSGLVENVLTYAGLEEEAKPRPRERWILAALLERVVPPLRRQAEAAGLRLDLENDAGDTTPVLVDADLIAGLLLNLVDNACKYAGRNGLEAEGQLHLTVASERSDLILRLRDHGPGIPEAEARKVFEPFVRGRHRDTDAEPGIGLGLALARRLARASGGDLTLQRSTDRGACFELRLPAGLAA